MRGKVSKAIGKLVYRDVANKSNLKTRYVKDPKTGTIYCTDERRAYLDAKRTIKNMEGRRK